MVQSDFTGGLRVPRPPLEALLRSFLFLIFIPFAAAVARADSHDIVSIPGPAVAVSAMLHDSSGDLYIAGTAATTRPGASGMDAFVARLSGDGSTVRFRTILGGSQFIGTEVIALPGDGTVLVAGTTNSQAFTVTPDAAEPLPSIPTGYTYTGYFARLDANGKVIYATYLNGNPSVTIPPFTLEPLAMAVDADGAAYITGQGIVNSTPGAMPAVDYNFGYFVMKIDAAGKIAFVTGAVGGKAIAVDSQGAIYVAGSEVPAYPLAVTSGAFQTSVTQSGCGVEYNGLGGGFPVTCPNQYVVKLNATASAIVYATWLSGTYGAAPSGLFVDAQGNAIVAGSTESTDYPVTAGAFQTTNRATNPPAGNVPLLMDGFYPVPGPPSTGYVSKLNAAGNGLVFSTFVGGSGLDAITAVAPEAGGDIDLAGTAQSPDFPGLPGGLGACAPSYVYPGLVFTRLSADGSALSATQLAYGLTPPTNTIAPIAATFTGDGGASIVVGQRVATLDLAAPVPQLACIADAANLAPLTAVAPGQLVALFGTNIGSDPAVATQAQDGFIPTAVGNLTVTFNGLRAPILYSSTGQINAQVPYEVASQSSVQMQISDGSLIASRDFTVAPIQPSVFVNAGYASCQGTITNWQLAVALNADGTVNSCSNPAVSGSTVTLFLNGLGLAGGTPASGAVAPSPATLINPPFNVSGTTSAESVPGTINGVWSVRVEVTPAIPFNQSNLAPFLVAFTNGDVVALNSVVLWAKPAQ